MQDEHIAYKNYSRLPSFFYPYAFNAKEWVDMVKEAGMIYYYYIPSLDGFRMR